MAGASVTTTIRLEGDDRASAMIDGARRSVEGMGKSLDHVAEKSGDLERGFRGVKDIVGKLGGEQLGRLTDAFGGIEGIIKGMPGPLGVVSLAIAAVGAGVAYWHERQKAAREEAAKAATERLEALQADKAALADSLSVSRELLGFDEKRQTATVQASVVLSKIAIDEKAKIEAQKTDNADLADTIQRRISARVNELRVLDQTLAVERGVKAIEEARTRDVENRQKEFALRELQAQGLLDKTSRVYETQRVIADRIADVETRRKSVLADDANIVDGTRKGKVLDLKLERERLELARTQLDLSLAVEKKKPSGKDDKAKEAAKAEAEVQAVLERFHQQTITRRDERIKREEEEANTIAQFHVDAAIARQQADAALFDSEGADAKKRIELARAERDAKIDAAFGVANAVSQGLEQIGIAEQAAAGIKALISAAEAGLAFARGNYAGAVAGAFAAVQFGRIALGAGSAPTVPGVGGGAGPSPAASPLAPKSGGGGNTYVVNFGPGFMVGSKQEIGKAITGALRSLDGSGVPASKGA